MNADELLKKMELIDPAFVVAADAAPKRKNRVWVKWGSLAACLCLIAAAAVALPGLLPKNEPAPDTDAAYDTVIQKPQPETNEEPVQTPIVPEQTSPKPADGLIVHFNKATARADAARLYIPGYFTQPLTAEELTALLPEKLPPDIDVSGYAGFDAEGTLLEVVLGVDAHFRSGTAVTVVFSVEAAAYGFAVEGEPVSSRLNGHDFIIYVWSPDGRALHYDAFGELSGCFVRISYGSDGVPAEEAGGDFTLIADYFTDYEDGRPDLSIIRATSIPEFYDKTLTLSEALADADFGAYLPGAVPGGFAEEAIRRYKDQNENYLSGLWTRGYDELRWQVSFYSEQDAARLTGVDEPENYDLSLYPIPRADSVPEALREIVNDPIFSAQELTPDAVRARAYTISDSGDSSGWRMAFSVRYDGILVRISAKGVEPDWLWQQLTALSAQ